VGTLIAGAGWFALVAFLLARVIRQSRAHGTAQVTAAAPSQGAAPGVAVIVPVRDEAANIGPCLAGLLAQAYPAGRYAILVVDDGSQDRTAEIVEDAAATAGSRVALHRAGRLPDGWLGKPHACWQGALRAGTADWLCFMDADVRAAPDLLRDAVGAAEAQGIAMLSLRPMQELGSFWERLIVPAGMLMVACAKDLRRVNDPGSPEAEANGQFILIRRDAYAAAGGHAAVRGEVCEDTALARRVKGAGQRLRVLAAEHLARTRMYRDLPSLWEGFSKNAVEIMGDARRTLAVAVAALLVGWAVPLLPVALGIVAWRHPSGLTAAGFGLASAGSLAVLGVVVGTLRHFRAPAALGLLFPLGTTMAAALAWRSVRLHRAGRVTWKGRTCPVGPTPSEDPA
jgi:chlorobactene glucosyltransferase